MDFRPLLKLSIDGVPLAAGPFSALSSVRVSDQLGVVSDTLEVTFANSALWGKFAMPSPGAELSVAMGYLGRFRAMGVFIADEVEESSPPRAISITGRAKVQGVTNSGRGPISQQKSRSWPAGLTLGAIVDTIAGENGLEPAATVTAAELVPGHLDQIDESDLNLLTRIAARFDLVAKPAGGSLFVGARGESITTSGSTLPTIVLSEKQLSTWRMRRSLGEITGSVVAVYRDLEAAADVEVRVGEDEPVRRLRGRFRDEAEAQGVANAEARRAGRAVEGLEFDMPGDPRLVSGSPVIVSNLSTAALNPWLVKEASHEISSGGFVTSVVAERPDAQ